MRFGTLAYRALTKIVYPVVPRANRLAFNYWAFRLCGRAEPELLSIRSIVRNRASAIDIGANRGVWTYGMSRCFTRVYSFEANEEVAEDLVASRKSNINVEICGLSSREGEASLYIPLRKGIQLTGWASLRSGNCPDTVTHLERKIRLKTLDSFGLSGVSFIKIDTEGHEVEVLRGAVKTFASNSPLALVEVMDTNRDEVEDYFTEIGYTETRLECATKVENLFTMRLYAPSSDR